MGEGFQVDPAALIDASTGVGRQSANLAAAAGALHLGPDAGQSTAAVAAAFQRLAAAVEGLAEVSARISQGLATTSRTYTDSDTRSDQGFGSVGMPRLAGSEP